MSSVWEFENEEQEAEMKEPITPDNCWKKLRLIREITGLSRKELAKILGVSESTITRIEMRTNGTKPSQTFMNKLSGLVAIGHATYSKMTKAEKNHLGEYLGMGGGVTAGIGASITAVSGAGLVGGLSAAGITSGLAAIGGGMLGGVAVVASIPVAIGAAGYGLVKGVKAICEANNLKCKEVDDRYEIVPNKKKVKN